MQKSNTAKRINTIIGLTIMFFGRFLPIPSMIVEPSERFMSMGLQQVDGGLLLQITPAGWNVITIFVGLIFLWTVVEIIWPSFLAVFLIGISGIAPMPVMLNRFLGNPQVVMIFFLLMFTAVIMKSNISVYIARYILTRPILKGRPWLLTGTFLLATYLMASLNTIAAVYLMWPVLYSIVTAAGYKKGDTYVNLMVAFTLCMCVLMFCTNAITGGSVHLILSLQGIAANSPELGIIPIVPAVYILFGFIISLFVILTLLLVMRFVFRLNLSRLKSIDMLDFQKDPLPPMSIQQKAVITLFGLYAAWFLLPGIIGTDNALGAFLAQNMFGGTILVMFFVTFLSFEGKPLVNLQEVNAAFPWQVFIIIATAFLLTGILSDPSTNIPLFIEFGFNSWLSGLGPFALTVAIIFIALVFTNFFNSVATGLILTPVLVIISTNMGAIPAPIIACFYFGVLFGVATPAASPFAAILFGNTEWITKKDAALNAMLVSLVVASVLVVVGIPLAKILF